jgi:hypothetical protein
VEEHLLEQALKMAGLKKVKGKLAPAEVEATTLSDAVKKVATTVTPQAQKQNQTLKTLTNATQATTSAPRTEAERKARAIARMRGELTT